ncbi:hypothetical protein [Bradyrhizobium sp. th.b2]|uniref:hypothetical protein n=1 Tax=Bradyrhizobium sp. th-b2 TaxID=172088 RepID=UPI0012ECAB17|nr:hypothetical protein [Bradyrhizobium sp. th.b2]
MAESKSVFTLGVIYLAGFQLADRRVGKAVKGAVISLGLKQRKFKWRQRQAHNAFQKARIHVAYSAARTSSLVAGETWLWRPLAPSKISLDP